MSIPHLTKAADAQRISWIGGSVHHVLLDSAATDSRLAMFRSSMRAGASSPVHVHDHEDETIFVLEGSEVAWAGDRRWELQPGDTAFLPRGVPHTYPFTSDRVELVTVCNPAGMEEFFRAAGWDLSSPPPEGWTIDPAELRLAEAACGQRVLGPPLYRPDEMPAAYLRAQRDG